VTLAAVEAVTSGAERIRVEDIDDIGFMPPSERRRAC